MNRELAKTRHYPGCGYRLLGRGSTGTCVSVPPFPGTAIAPFIPDSRFETLMSSEFGHAFQKERVEA